MPPDGEGLVLGVELRTNLGVTPREADRRGMSSLETDSQPTLARNARAPIASRPRRKARTRPNIPTPERELLWLVGPRAGHDPKLAARRRAGR